MPSFSLAEMLGRFCPRLTVLDVGAMWISPEEMPYRRLAKAGVASIVGFEAVKQECDKLTALGLKDHTFLNYTVGDGSQRTLHVTNFSATTSLYEPNMALGSRFNNLAELTQVVKTIPVQTVRLDDVKEVTACDFLKMDVQGAEMDVMRGAERLLRDVLVVQTEVEFVHLYLGQPLFADVDAHMRARGFSLHWLMPSSGRAFKPIVVEGNINRPLHQSMWSDAVYVRDFMRFDELTPEQLLKIAVLVHDMYDSCDLAALALQHHDAKTGKQLWEAFLQRLTGKKPPPKPTHL